MVWSAHLALLSICLDLTSHPRQYRAPLSIEAAESVRPPGQLHAES
jgi:hypothetical protein